MIQPLRGWKGRCLKEDATVCSKGKGEGRVKGGVEAPFPRGWEGTSAGEGKMCKLKRTAGERGGGGGCGKGKTRVLDRGLRSGRMQMMQVRTGEEAGQ